MGQSLNHIHVAYLRPRQGLLVEHVGGPQVIFTSATERWFQAQNQFVNSDQDHGKNRLENHMSILNSCGQNNHKPSPSHHHKYIGGMVPIPGHGWFMALFFPHRNM